MTQEKASAFIRITRLQVAAGILGSLALAAFGQVGYALSFVFGSMLMVVNAWWLSGRLAKTRNLGVEAGQRSLYAGAALRFVALIAGLLVAQLIGLHLLAVAAGMFIAQLVLFFAALTGFNKEDKGDGFG